MMEYFVSIIHTWLLHDKTPKLNIPHDEVLYINTKETLFDVHDGSVDETHDGARWSAYNRANLSGTRTHTQKEVNVVRKLSIRY